MVLKTLLIALAAISFTANAQVVTYCVGQHGYDQDGDPYAGNRIGMSIGGIPSSQLGSACGNIQNHIADCF